MPEQLYPPFAGDSGAIIEPRQLQRWMDRSPQNGALRRAETYLTIGTFSIEQEWLGYSQLIAAFPFTSPNNFTLTPYEEAPDDINYVLCVVWVDEDLVVRRYKMWEGVDEVMSEFNGLYTGQLIMKNFRFEIWSTGPAAANPLVLYIPVNVIGGEDSGVIAGEG